MAIIITAPTVGSLKIANLSASPQNTYLCNLKTVTVNGDFSSNSIKILNDAGQPLAQLPLNLISNIGASASPFSMSVAVDDIAALIITT